MPSAVVHSNPKQFNYIDCIFVDFFSKTGNNSLCWLCEHRGLPAKPNSSNNHMADAVLLWISEWKCRLVERNRESNRKREWMRSEGKKAERKPTIVCPGALGTRRGVNSDSFQRDGQLNLRAASLQAMAILFCLRLPLWASTESSI